MAKIKTTGSFKGKSNALGYGGRSAQLKAAGVPGGVIGALARKAGAAPGQPNYHGGKVAAKPVARAAPSAVPMKQAMPMRPMMPNPLATPPVQDFYSKKR